MTYERAVEIATQKHQHQKRKYSGEPYIMHPIRVAQIVLKYKESKHIHKLRIAAVLHDTFEDTDYTYEECWKEFGFFIANLVLELTTPKNVKGHDKANYLSKKTRSMTSYALVIKLADRMNNVSDLRYVSKSFRQKYIKETRIVIANLIANRTLSMTQVQLIHEILKEINGVAKLDEMNMTVLVDVPEKNGTVNLGLITEFDNKKLSRYN